MTDANFFDRQNNLTAAKILIYKEYLKGYLPKVLMQYEACFISDLFCGTGKNGDKQGSPLILLDTIKYILTNEIIKKSNPKVSILFNDSDKNNIQNLREELEGFLHNSINILPTENKKFEEIIPELIKTIQNHDIRRVPKFFFLDPYTYPNIRIDDLKKLMNLEHTEVLLFLPIFHSYRFSSDIKMKKDHKTRIFVEEFTKKGIADYENIDDFLQSIKEKLQEKMGLDFVRPVLLDGGSSKNALFLLTKSQIGMLEMNKISLKVSEDGKGINTKCFGQKSLFGTQGTSKFEIFLNNFIKLLKQKEEMTNKEIVKFTIMEEFIPKYAKEILKDLYSKNKILVFDIFGNEIKKQTQWNIAEKITKDIIFRWKE